MPGSLALWLAPTTKTRISLAVATVPRLASTTKVGATSVLSPEHPGKRVAAGDGRKSTDDCWRCETNINPVDHGKWHDVEFYAGDTWKFNRRVTLTYACAGLCCASRTTTTTRWRPSAWQPIASHEPRHPNDACNGVIVVPGTSFCQASRHRDWPAVEQRHPGR